MYYRSRNGKYHVQVAEDGAIRVKPGDWLSKYSAAIHNNFWAIREFARRDASGRFVAIRNPNRIYAGETIYHLPSVPRTAIATFDTGSEFDPPRLPPMPEEERKKLILEHLEGEFDLRGEHLEILEKLAHYVHSAADFAEAGEAIAHIFVHVPEALAAGVEYFSLLGAAAFPIMATIQWINANEFGYRLLGFRAVAYGITAWAFNDPVPAPPGWIRTNYIVSGLGKDVPAAHRAWNASAHAAIRHMGEMATKRDMRKEHLQLLFRAMVDEDRNKLVKEIMEGIAKKELRAGTSEIGMFWSPEPNYPN